MTFKSELALKVSSLWKWAHLLVRQFHHWLFAMLQCLWLVNVEFCSQSEFELTFPSRPVLRWPVQSESLCETVQLTLKSELANSRWRETRKVSLLSKCAHILVKRSPDTPLLINDFKCDMGAIGTTNNTHNIWWSNQKPSICFLDRVKFFSLTNPFVINLWGQIRDNELCWWSLLLQLIEIVFVFLSVHMEMLELHTWKIL